MYEFRFGGEVGTRPQPDAPREAWNRYLYEKANEAGVQKEWWYHRGGCHAWFLALRDTRSNLVIDVIRPEAAAR